MTEREAQSVDAEAERLERAVLDIKLSLLELCRRQVIHIGGDLSVAEIMTVLWQRQMRYDPRDPEWGLRDRFVLSKGHASAVMSLNQAAIGCFSADDVLTEYATDGGRFSMHSCALVNPYVEVSTGSLGHGFPVACGIAQALRIKGNKVSRVYTIMGDGEQAEGSVWEAAMNASHLGLGNLVAIVDWNGLEADGYVDQITGLGDIAQKYRACGWRVEEFDGNDVRQLLQHFDRLPAPSSDVPTAFVCHTRKGSGVPFMEDDVRWHAGKVDDSQYEEAVRALTGAYEGRHHDE